MYRRVDLRLNGYFSLCSDFYAGRWSDNEWLHIKGLVNVLVNRNVHGFGGKGPLPRDERALGRPNPASAFAVPSKGMIMSRAGSNPRKMCDLQLMCSRTSVVGCHLQSISRDRSRP